MNYRTRTASAHVFTGLVLTVAILMCFESLSRIVFTMRADLSALSEEWYTYSPELGWENRPGFTGTVVGELRRGDPTRYLRQFDADGFFTIDTPQRTGTDHKRILAIGDSNTFGWGVPTDASFVEVLDDMLPEADIVNLGVSGYTSYQGYAALVKHIDTVQPDIVIASFNFNDRRFVSSADAVDSQDKFARDEFLHRIDLIRDHVYLYRSMRSALTRLGLAPQAPLQPVGSDVRHASVRVSPADYRRNLEQIARLCEERRIPLVLIVLRDNPAHTHYLRAGLAHLEEGQVDLAERDLRIAVNLENWFSDLARKYLAAVLDQRGAVEEAQAIATLPAGAGWSAHGGRPLYLDSEYNDIMRSVGRAHGARVIEAGDALTRDPSLYLDLCHPDERGHRLIALLLKPAIDALLQSPSLTASHSTGDRSGS